MTNEVKNAVNLIKEYLALDKDIEGNEYLDSLRIMVQALESQPSKDCISRESLRQKLQKEHDFFVNSYGGFNNLPQNDKARVDEIDNCIAMVVNEPSVTPQRPKGKWIKTEGSFKCSECLTFPEYIRTLNYCPSCGSYNGGGEKDED